MHRYVITLFALTLCAACAKNTPPAETAAHPGEAPASHADPDDLPEPADNSVLEESSSGDETRE